MKKIIKITVCLMATTIFCSAQNTHTIGKKTSQKVVEQINNVKKETAVEIPIARNIDVCIENTNRAVEIKTWNESKIKIVANTIDNEDIVSNENLLEKINVKTKLFGKNFKIIADVIGGNNASKIVVNNTKNILTIYVPKENGLSIKSKYADVTVLNAVNKLDIDITNGNLELDIVKNLSLISKYANVFINEIENAEIDFMNGDLSIITLGNGEVETKYAKIEIGTAKKITLNSTNDDYEIEEIDVLDGNKNYGNMRIGNLNESIQIDGTNADVKIKKINRALKSIWFNNKYANLKLPLKEIRNFELNYEGSYSTIFNSFMSSLNKNDNSQSIDIKANFGNLENVDPTKITTGDIQSNKFSATVGTGSTKVNIKCQNCTVDFK